MKSASEFIAEWKREQSELRARVVIAPLDPLPRFVAGADAAFGAEDVYAAAVVYDRETQCIVEIATVKRSLEFPYIPGYLSFREGPAVRAALEELSHPFGAILFDGQGLAHPRRCGLATHVGVLLDMPAVGCAKSRLTGTHGNVATKAGASVPLMDGDEVVGAVLRTRDNVNPLYISVGHRVDLASAQALVLACQTKYRMPEPTRNADREVTSFKKQLAAKKRG